MFFNHWSEACGGSAQQVCVGLVVVLGSSDAAALPFLQVVTTVNRKKRVTSCPIIPQSSDQMNPLRTSAPPPPGCQARPEMVGGCLSRSGNGERGS